MNAKFDTLEFAHAIEATRLGKAGSETMARAISDIAMKNVATTADVDRAIHTLTLRLGVMLGVGLGIACAFLGALISLK